MPELVVAGARLHYSSIGQGPLLLCISGQNGDCEIWQRLAYYLRNRFTVAVYDRRGFSRSPLVGPQNYSERLDTDAEDAAAIIAHLSPQEPATVFGTGSGAVVALTLLLRHSTKLRLLIAHETLSFTLQSGTDELFAEQSAIYDVYRANGIHPAVERFGLMTKTPEADMRELHAEFDGRSGPHRQGNAVYWFERELMQYSMAKLSVDMFQPYRAKLMPINALLTPKDAPQSRANERLAEALGLELILLPGARVGYASHTAAFAEDLVKALRKRDDFYATL